MALLVTMTLAPDRVFAQSACTRLVGPEKAACAKEEVRQRVDQNRRDRDAKKADIDGQAIGAQPAVPGRDGGPGAIPYRGPYAERPLIDLNAKPPTMTLITHPSYSRETGRWRIYVARYCGGGTPNEDFTFDKACKQATLRNFDAARPLFKQSCDEGDPSGCFEYADLIVGRDRTAANALYAEACENGHHRACYAMATAYEDGAGVSKDPAQQRRFYDKACTYGNTYGCAFVAGKIDPRCPHGGLKFSIDLQKKVNRLLCVTNTGILSVGEREVVATPQEVALMKEMAAHPSKPLSKSEVETMQSWLDPGERDDDCSRMDSKDLNGRPIVGSGCAGKR